MSAAHQPGGITDAQRRMLMAGRRQLRMSEDNYRGMLSSCAGVTSSRDLTPVGLDAVLAFMQSLGWRNTSPKRHLGLRAGMASDAQLGLVRRLATSYFDQAGDAALCKWLECSFGVSHPRFLTTEAAQKAITGLKQMTARRAPPAP